MSTFAPRFKADSVAQLVEQRPFKPWVLGSNPSGITKNAVMVSQHFLFTILYLQCTILIVELVFEFIQEIYEIGVADAITYTY